MLKKLSYALALALVLVACTPGGGGGTKPTINSFTATPTLPAGGGTTTLAWNVTGATSLSIDQGVGSVTPLTTGSTTKAITATTTFTLTATNAAGNVTATATTTVATVTTITVSGKVIDFFGQGAAGLAVKIGSTTVTTAGDGTFSIPNVTTPYDAAVINSASKIVNVYKGLTRPDPTLTAINVIGVTPPKSATFSGNLSGGAGFPNPANHTTRVFFGSPETLQSVSSPAGPAYGLMSAAWFGPDSTTGNVYALQWQFDPGTGLPVDYKGYGSTALSLSNGGSFAGVNVSLGSIAEDTISGSVTVPTGYTLNARRVNLKVAAGSGALLLSDSSAVSNYSYTTPRITGATVSLLAVATSGTKQSFGWKAGAATNSSGVNIALSPAPSLTVPVNNATGVTINTDFQTTGFSGGVNLFFFRHLAGSNPDIYVITTGTTTKIPDLSSVGLGLPTTGAVPYQWQIFGIAPFASADAAAGAGGFLKDYVKIALLGSGSGPDADGGFGQSETFNFTTP